MSMEYPTFVSWEEHIISHERGNRRVHFCLKDTDGDLVLAVVGTERSIRHMMYNVTEEFIQAYGSSRFVNSSTKWRARREVVDWLTTVVSQGRPAGPFMITSGQEVGSLDTRLTGNSAGLAIPSDILLPRKLKVQDPNIEWSSDAWVCAKQLKHYQSFCRNEDTIAVHSFVSLVAEEDNHYIGYLEDMYEDKKGQKRVKVRWFLHNQEVKAVVPDLDSHPSEIFITAQVQVINAECIDSLATVLTPRHYDRCISIIPEASASSIFICMRQIKGNGVKPFTLTKLRGYSNQSILALVDDPPQSKQKLKGRRLDEEDEEWSLDEPPRVSGRRRKHSTEHEQLKDTSVPETLPSTNPELKYPKLKFKLPKRKAPEPQSPESFKVGDKLEFLCQDSGIRGCWFRCTVLKVSSKNLRVKYDDVEDADGTGKLEEWIPASRVAAPDKLGMRCSGRLTVRPPPSSNTTGINPKVGSPVDVWWSDGWWEGVVTRVKVSRKDSLQVYLPGEANFLTVKRENIRVSKDWVENKWVDVNPKPDILSCISTIVNPTLIPCGGSTKGDASGSGSRKSVEHKVPLTSKLETIIEDDQELSGSAMTNDAENLNDAIKKQLSIDKTVNNNGGDKDAGEKAKGISKDAEMDKKSTIFKQEQPLSN